MRTCLFILITTLAGCLNTKTNDHMEKEDLNNLKMNTLGLIGGTSWHSTIEYYRFINEKTNSHFGNNTNPPLIVYTLNQAKVHKYQNENNWDGIADMIVFAGKNLENAGAQKLMLCANTPHKVYDKVIKELSIPIIHIAEATAIEIKKMGIDKVCFLGTKYTMTENFITSKIENYGIEVMVPSDEEQINELHRIIIEELTYGKILPKSKVYVENTIQSFIDKGAKGVILGCTEFPLMFRSEELNIPIFNTTDIHANSGVNYILSDFLQE